MSEAFGLVNALSGFLGREFDFILKFRSAAAIPGAPWR